MKKYLGLNRYRPDIDGLRAIAVIAVILFHINKSWLPGGFTGVDIFFVISGYVVTSSIINHQSNSVLDYFLGFYTRRIKRIFPALIACVTVTTLLAIIFLPTSEVLEPMRSAIWSLIGWNNNFLIGTSLDYFNADQSLNPFLHTWSLGVEEQFYLVFPIFLLIIYGLKRPIEKKPNFKLWILISTIGISAILSMWLSFTNTTWAYYFMPSRFWELGAGALLFILLAQGFDFKLNAHPLINPSLQLGAFLLMGISLFAINDKSQFPFPWALPSVLGTVMFIASGAVENNLINRLVGSRPLVYIGKLSYSLYLWHWPILTLFNWTVRLDSSLNVVIALLMTFAFSSASYYWIEKPIREFKKIKIPDGKILSIGLGSLALAIGTIYIGFKNERFLEKLSLRKYPKDAQAYEKGNWKDPNSPMMPDYPQITSGNCMFPKGDYYSLDKVKLNLCATQPSSERTQTIFLIGDSHAVHLFPMFREMFKQDRDIRLLTTWKWNCVISDSLDIMISETNRGYCIEFTKGEISKAVKLLKPGDIAIISTSLNLQITGLAVALKERNSKERVNNLVMNGMKVDQKTKLKEYANSLKRIANQFSAAGIKTILWVDNPEVKRNPLACVDLLFWEIPKENCSSERTIFEQMQKIVLEVFTAVKNSNPDVYIFNPNDILAPNGELKLIDENGLFVMEDENHISQAAARRLAIPFYQFLQENNLIKTKN